MTPKTGRRRSIADPSGGARRGAALAFGIILLSAALLGGQLVLASPALGGLVSTRAANAATSVDPSASTGPTGTAEPNGSVAPTGSATPTGSAEPTSSALATPTPIFAKIAGRNLHIHLPAPAATMIAVGFHQADNKKAFRFVPTSSCHRIDTRAAIRKWLASSHDHLLFQQPLRGRGSSNLSAADCAVPRETTVVAPVTGLVTSVKKYKLYGRIDDVRLEFMPTTATGTRVVMLHIKDIKVRVGDRVVGGVTPVARVRNLKLDSTVNHYFSAKNADHVHIQVNDKNYKSPLQEPQARVRESAVDRLMPTGRRS